MTESTDNKQTTVSLRGRITGVEVMVTFQVASEELKKRLSEVLEQLTEVGIESVVENRKEVDHDGSKEEPEISGGAGPLGQMARELQVQVSDLTKILGIKGETVDLFRAGRLPVADALSAICFAYEKGLGKPGMTYETFQALVQANQIKMKTPLPTVCFNLINGGRIDSKQYNDDKFIVLTPDGERKATETLKALITGGAKERRVGRGIGRPRKKKVKGTR